MNEHMIFSPTMRLNLAAHAVKSIKGIVHLSSGVVAHRDVLGSTCYAPKAPPGKDLSTNEIWYISNNQETFIPANTYSMTKKDLEMLDNYKPLINKIIDK